MTSAVAIVGSRAAAPGKAVARAKAKAASTIPAMPRAASTAPTGSRQPDESENGRRRRQQPPRAAGIESDHREPPGPLDLAGEHAGDEKAGDDEEDIDADEAAGHSVGADVKQHDQPDGDRSQALDV